MAALFLRFIGQAEMDGRRPVRAIGHHGLQRLLLDSGGIFMLTGTLILMHKLATTSASAPSNAELFIAFILWLLGAAFGMLSVVALQFPKLTVAAAAVARALRNYLLGGL